MTGDNRKTQHIVIFSVSAGAGHVRAAQALQAAAERWYPDVNVTHIDVMDLVPKLFRKVYTDTFLKVVERHPAFWGYLYERTDREKVDSALSRLLVAIERLNTRRLKKVLQESDPDLVICTHFLPAQILARKIRKGDFTRPVWVQVTDFDVHALWLHEGMSGYFAANEEVAWRMAERGIPPASVHATGIPIMPVFGDPQSRCKCAAEFNLDPDRKTLLLMSGGTGIGDIEQLAQRLLRMDRDFQVVALAGRNQVLLSTLTELAAGHPRRLFPLGFTGVIERVMAASDLAITKPGGLTTSECLAMGLPMIVVAPIPGQEERNADFLLENGAALKACDPGALAYRVAGLLDDTIRMNELRKNSLRLGKPDAARSVLDIVLGRVGAETGKFFGGR